MMKILFINREQFGYHIDYYYYAKILSTNQDYDISYVCWDYQKLKVPNDNVKVHYIKKKGVRGLSTFYFIHSVIFLLKKSKELCARSAVTL